MHTDPLALEATPPRSSRRLPVAAFASVSDLGEARVLLHVFCPRAVAATPLDGCRECSACIAFDAGEDAAERGATPSVLCGW
jgi:hypothetical protein